MRLMNTKSGRLETFVANIPPYAIFSHTWGGSEVTFADLSVTLHPASDKIKNICRLAREQELTYVWIDTCCIDKSSSAELTESINSMFKWYQQAVVCYVFLEDFDADCASFARCRWFTRSWTLQELLAPKRVEFYDKNWNFKGIKQELIGPISIITRIPPKVLGGEWSLEECSIASRMSWAAGRKSSKPEDIAYSLLGLFNVHIPPIYGEGKNAFRRLQEEIIKRSNDLTILAWRYPQSFGSAALDTLGLLAESPDWFQSSTTIHPYIDSFTTRFAITNQGLHVSGDTPLRLISVADGEDRGTNALYAIYLGFQPNPAKREGIYLRKLGPNLFRRDFRHPMARFDDKDTLLETWDVPDFHILIDPSLSRSMARFFRTGAVHVPHSHGFKVLDAVPAPLWDHTERMFLKSKPHSWAGHEAVLALGIRWSSKGHSRHLIVLCDCRDKTSLPIIRILPPDPPPVYATALFSPRRRNTAVSWEELEAESPGVLESTSQVEAQVGNSTLSFSAELMEDISTWGLKMLSLTIHAEKKQPQLPSDT